MAKPPFADYGTLLAQDPYDLAAGALPLVFDSDFTTSLRSLTALVDGWVTAPGAGIFSTSIEIRVATHRIVLIWERALAACRTYELDGFERQSLSTHLLLLDPSLRTRPHDDLVAHLRHPDREPALR